MTAISARVLLDLFLMQILQDHQRGVAIGDKAGGHTAGGERRSPE